MPSLATRRGDTTDEGGGPWANPVGNVQETAADLEPKMLPF